MKKFLKGVLFFIVFLVLLLFVNHIIYSLQYKKPEFQAGLTQSELQDIKEAKRLKESYGNNLFNGFGSSHIPVIAYNNSYEFLIYDKPLDSSFSKLDESNNIVNDNIYVRKCIKPAAFAVKVGNVWAGSMPTLYFSNYEMLEHLKKELPLGIWLVVPPQLLTIKRDLLPSLIIHEDLHAYFGNINEEKLNAAEASHKTLKYYPYGNKQFENNWDSEGKALYNAMNSQNRKEIIKYTKDFLNLRDKRRMDFNLSSDTINCEKLIEWEEGLGKYCEIKMYDFASEDSNAPAYYKYKKNRPYSSSDFRNLRNNLGSRQEDYRFYLSGMAESMILDKLSTTWKNDIYKNGIYLEDKLRQSVINN